MRAASARLPSNRTSAMTTRASLASRLLATGVLFVLVSAAFVPAAASGHRQRPHRERDAVWVVNRDQGTVTVFDAATGEPTSDSPFLVGPGVHDIVSSPRTGT